MNNYIYLNDSNFLEQIIKSHVITYFVKIIILDWQQNPINEIQGNVISANFNIDGQSSIRRTGNISFIPKDNIINIMEVNQLISINKKINVQIGYKNITNKYTDFPIIWFPLGLYVITSASISHSISDLNISLQLKDKMCFLNGECGGTLPAATVFDNYLTIDQNGQEVISKPTIYQIIRELVNHFGRQQLGKIIISDLDTRVKQAMKWAGNSPLYFVQKNNQYELTTDNSYYQQLLEEEWVDVLGSPFEFGQDVGYIYTNFTYPGDLIGQAGNTVTDILDQIIEVLGNYEYFYDINGNFVFQEIKNYLNNTQTKYILDNLGNRILVADYIADLRTYEDLLSEDYLLNNKIGKSVYQFKDSSLITSYTNNPQYQQIKNDFIVWGIKTLPSGNQIPIRYHLAIDKKPKIGNIYKVFAYQDPEDNLIKYHCPIAFENKNNFPVTGASGVFYLDKSNNKIYKWDKDDNNVYQYILINSQLISVKTKDWRTQLYFQGVSAQPYGTQSNYYYTQLYNEWPKLFELVNKGSFYQDKIKDNVLNHPEQIDFFLDIIDSTSKIGEFQIDNIGRRTKVLNQDKNVNCIFQPQIPDIILLPLSDSQNPHTQMGKMRREAIVRGQTWWQVNDSIYSFLTIGGSLNSGYQVIRQLLHQYTSYNENISFNCLPIYWLQPNTRIEVRDEQSFIYGDYMINSISFSLGDAEDTMTINCVKALEKI